MRLLDEADHEVLIERIQKGKAYFSKALASLLVPLLVQIRKAERLTKVKGYIAQLEAIDAQIMGLIHAACQASQITALILSNQEAKRSEEAHQEAVAIRQTALASMKEMTADLPALKRKSGRKKKGSQPKAPKGETYTKTLAMIQDGKTIDEIADIRGMAVSTIEGHAARLINQSEIELDHFITKDQAKEIAKAIALSDKAGLKGAVNALEGKYTFGQVRMVKAMLDRYKEK